MRHVEVYRHLYISREAKIDNNPFDTRCCLRFSSLLAVSALSTLCSISTTGLAQARRVIDTKRYW